MDTIINDLKLGVIGCGKMATAIIGGIVKSKFLSSNDICVYDVNMDATGALCQEFDVKEAYSINEIMESCDVVLLAVKPFKIAEVLLEMKEKYNEQLILSILAGVKIKKFQNNLKNARVIRIMPNTPALVNEGASAICASSNVSQDEVDFAYNLMSKCGRVIKTNEEKIDIITALSGSGPAFYFKIIELMAKSATKLGLDRDDALLLSAQTALGSAKMIFENNFDTDKLIQNVTTKGGCTEVGNNVLAESDIEEIFDKLIKDTMQKAIELG